MYKKIKLTIMLIIIIIIVKLYAFWILYGKRCVVINHCVEIIIQLLCLF